MRGRSDLKGWYKLRWQILYRDKYTCQYCGQAAPNVQLEVDHIIPVVDGGTDDLSNLATSCWACNRGKCGLREAILFEKEKKIKSAKNLTRRDEVLAIFQSSKRGLKIKDVADIANITFANANIVIFRLKTKGFIKKVNGLWEAS